MDLMEPSVSNKVQDLESTALYPVQQAPPARTLVDILNTTTSLYHCNSAIDDGKVCLSYAELQTRIANQIGDLRALGIGAGDRVGVRMSSGTADLYTSILSVLVAGATYVPVDLDDPDDRAQLIWSEAAVCAVITDRGILTCAELSSLESPGSSSSVRQPRLEDDAWIIFTSGSTGKPKAVAVTHRSAAAFVDAEAQLFASGNTQSLGPGDRVLAGLSVAFDASCEEMWLAWRHGACLVPAPRSLVKAGPDLGTFLRAQRISVVSTVPTLAALWPPTALSGVRLLIVGGEACSPDLADRVVQSVAPNGIVWNTYGPTEATVVCCAARLKARNQESVKIGLPLAGAKLAIVNTDGQPVRWGEVGELVIGGVGLARYIDKDMDAAHFTLSSVFGAQYAPERVYRTGDMVRADREGLIYVGRNDEQIKLGGRRIELAEIDAALMGLPGVDAAASMVRQVQAGHQILVGYIVRRGSPVDDGQQKRDRDLLLQTLPSTLVPLLINVDSIPMRTSGKADREALPWPPPSKTGELVQFEGITGFIADQWHKVLGVPVHSTDAHFFDLGGTSLAVAQLVTGLRTKVISIAVADIYEHPTFADLVSRIEGLAVTEQKERQVVPTPYSAGLIQLLTLLGLFTYQGLQWLVLTAIFECITSLIQEQSLWTSLSFNLLWWQLLIGWLVFFSMPGKVLTTAAVVRLVTFRMRPGKYSRGGSAHLRLWTAERIVILNRVYLVAGTHWCRYYARLLGCQVGPGAQLHALPPVTGMAHFGTCCAVEPEADIAGWWLDGDTLQIGSITIGEGARIGTRTTVMPNTVIETLADVGPGLCVMGTIQGCGEERAAFETTVLHAVAAEEGLGHQLRYTISLLLLEALPVLTAVPAVIFGLWMINSPEANSWSWLLLTAIWLGIPVSLISILCYASITIILVKLTGRYIKRGVHSWHSSSAWAAWFTFRIMWETRIVLFPFYSSIFTPTWLSLLGADIGRRVEMSTVLACPSLLRVGDGSFIADDVLAGPYELAAGKIRLGVCSIGNKSFVGNSAIVRLEHIVPDGVLIGVLGSAPEPGQIAPGSSWLGRPAMSIPRKIEEYADHNRTFDPPFRLMLARSLVEIWRFLPLFFSSLLAELFVGIMTAFSDIFGIGWTIALSGVLFMTAGILACMMAAIAKWSLTPKILPGDQHPLWSFFVWRNELADVFVESLAVPWLIRLCEGTPLMSLWFWSLGAKVGQGVWCDSHNIPEPNLVSIGTGASINRGSIIQTHLFHDRLMRLDTVDINPGATIGAHSILLPGTVVQSDTTIGCSSLVMRGEKIPKGCRWLGNPVRLWLSKDN